MLGGSIVGKRRSHSHFAPLHSQNFTDSGGIITLKPHCNGPIENAKNAEKENSLETILFRKWKIRKIEIRYEKYTFFLNGGFFSALMITSFSKGKIQAYLRSNLKEILKKEQMFRLQSLNNTMPSFLVFFGYFVKCRHKDFKIIVSLW